MSTQARYYGFQPDPGQELLLKAALQKDDSAITHWDQWISSHNIESVDPGSQRILPLVYRNLVRLQCSHPCLGILKGLYRKTWYTNQMLFREAAACLAALQQSGISTLLLKGAPLALLYYKDAGVRPMRDIDVMVPVRQTRDAVDCLTSLGWSLYSPLPEDLRLEHAVHLTKGEWTLDLHWHATHFARWPEADEELWASAQTIKLVNESSLTLCDTDHLFQVCIHGTRPASESPCRWIADAITLLGCATIDWERLFTLSRKYRVTHLIRETLRYLHTNMNAEIPPGVQKEVESWNPGRMERIESAAWNSRSPASSMIYHYQACKRATGGSGLRSFGVFPAYLKSRWKINSAWKIPWVALDRGCRKLWAAALPRR